MITFYYSVGKYAFEGAGCQLEWQRNFLSQFLNMFSFFFFVDVKAQRANIAQ
jgi:hypothetical protein